MDFDLLGGLILNSSLYAISVRQARGLPSASFRFRLATDTLAIGYIFPATGQIPDFHRLETCAAGRTKTKKNPGQGANLARDSPFLMGHDTRRWPSRYCNKDSTLDAFWLAWDSMDWDAWRRTVFFVYSIISFAMSASRMVLSDAVTFSAAVVRLAEV